MVNRIYAIIILVSSLLSLALNSSAITIGMPIRFLNLGDVSVNTVVVTKSFTLELPAANNYFTLNTTAPFSISIDSNNYSQNITIPAPSASLTLTVLVKYTPNVSYAIDRQKVFVVYGPSDTNTLRMNLYGSTFSKDSFYSILSWNTMWLGRSTMCNCDTALQRSNITSFLSELKPNIIALQEVTTIPQFDAIVASIGAPYVSQIATYASQALTTSSGNYPLNQKTAFLIDTTIFDTIGTYGFAFNTTTDKSSTSPYWAFSSGRMPMISVLAEKNTTDTTYWINIHAKANGDLASYNRRQNGSFMLQDSINTYYKGKMLGIIGDYNDKLEGSIFDNYPSPYLNIIDTTLLGISLPSLYPGASTYILIDSSFIDNMCLSKAIATRYQAGSFTILNELTRAYTNFASTTSDHYPVIAYFKRGIVPDTVAIPATMDNNYTNKDAYKVLYNGNLITISGGSNASLYIYNLNGNLINTLSHKNQTSFDTSTLPTGMYVLSLVQHNGFKIIKFIVP
jgi:trimeric autotransporter adhesin